MLAVRPGILVPGSIQGVEAVEVSAGGACRLALAPAPSNGVGPSSWPGLRHYCGPASLRRQLCWLDGGEGKAVQGES